MNQLKETIEKKKKLLTVNSTVNSYKDINNTVNSIPIKEEYRELEKKTDELLNELRGNPEFVADKLARELDDVKSEQYYLILAKNNDPQILLEALSCVLMTYDAGNIKTKKASYFLGILKKKGIATKFRR